MATPEKINIWDRFFNRYRRVVDNRGLEVWTAHDIYGKGFKYKRDYVDYKVIDRLTGNETLERKYLN